jgi:hypothetical protein
MNVYGQNPTAVEEVTLHDLEILSVLHAVTRPVHFTGKNVSWLCIGQCHGLYSLHPMTLLKDIWQTGYKTQTVAL